MCGTLRIAGTDGGWMAEAGTHIPFFPSNLVSARETLPSTTFPSPTFVFPTLLPLTCFPSPLRARTSRQL